MMELLALSDTVWNAIIAGIVTIALALVARWGVIAVTKDVNKAVVKAEAVVASADKAVEKVVKIDTQVDSLVEVAEVAGKAAAKVEAMDEKLDDIAEVTGAAKRMGEATHDLVNSGSLAQRKLLAVALRRIADRDHRPEDIEDAEEAEKLYAEHKAKQKLVDKEVEERGPLSEPPTDDTSDG